MVVVGIFDELLIALLYLSISAFAVVAPLCFFVLPFFYIAIAERRFQYALVCSCVTFVAHLILYAISEINTEYDMLFIAGVPVVQAAVCVICHYIWKWHFRPSKDKLRAVG